MWNHATNAGAIHTTFPAIRGLQWIRKSRWQRNELKPDCSARRSGSAGRRADAPPLPGCGLSPRRFAAGGHAHLRFFLLLRLGGPACALTQARVSEAERRDRAAPGHDWSFHVPADLLVP